MDIRTHLSVLQNNRLMENETEIHKFEVSLSKVHELDDISVIQDLCLAFDDNTHQFDIMFSLVHVIEHLYRNNVKEGLTLIAKSISKITKQATEWIEILHYRILNHPQVRLIYREVLYQIDTDIATNIRGFLIEIKDEDPERFSEAVNEVINN
ncbi:Imm30 family immunity protein [Terribacillus saccharophilus]|uniref:Imm30 family immunity protein n=1 Tax=Terribacillus saccharophilus TaxID=361277 RepID=UPI003982C921